MAQKFELEPFGVNETKRLTVPAAETALYSPREIPHGFVRMVDYLGGDKAIYRAMTGGAGGEVVGNLSAPELFDSARDMGATNGFKFAQVKMHVLMPIQSALYWVYNEDFQLNEYSGRYSVMMDSGRGLKAPEIETILADKIEGLSKGKKRSVVEGIERLFTGSQEAARGMYKMFIETGMAREIARIGLGQGVHTTFYVSANLEQYMSAISRAKSMAKKHPDCRHLGPEAEEFESLLKSVAPEAVDSYNRGVQGRLNPVPVKINREALEKNPDKKPRYGISKTKRFTNKDAEKLLWKPQSYLDKGWFLPTDYSGGDASVVQSARTSYGSGTTKTSEDQHLTRYLRRHRHTTPSESVEVQAEQKTPVFVWPRQGGRHRTTDKEGVLGTFVFLNDFYQIPDEQIRSQSRANRQGRGNKLEERTQKLIRLGLEFAEESERWAQEELSERGIPLEVSDAQKGVGFYTRGTIKTDLHNALHFLGLRNDAHAQHEIRVNAQQFEDFVKAVAPWSHQAFLDYQRNSMTFTAPELPLVGRMIAEGKKEIPISWYKAISWTNTNGTKGREANELDAKIKKFSEFMKKG